MFNWFKKKEKIENPIEISVSGINPQTENEFLFYNFVELTFAPHLEKWYEKAKSNRIEFKPKYEKAIKQKIKTSKFKNPHSFPEYFNSQFDHIVIDFETANQNRISACALGLGLVFIKNDRIVYQTSFHIKPPESEQFSTRNIKIHGITAEDVDYAMTFDELWESELSKYFNQNLIVFHNASMDLSVLKNLFEHYLISGYKLEYLDTMQLAEKSGNPKKLAELADKFDIEFIDKHNPEEDAKVCAYVFGELAELYPDYKSLVRTLSEKEVKEKIKRKKETTEVKNQNLNYVQVYSLKDGELEKIDIKNKGFIFTGEITTDRSIAKKIIEQNGGIIKSKVTSKVDYVVIGTDFGWSKIQKVHELNENKNCNIRILTNSDFENLKKNTPHNKVYN
ncbi:exonuclease domain-containing protein [Tenacibaculum piscium]|uniref:exonuclease domain-containing protein n=1 Tax=Tenacibaculum piscium TaxID=1458515 RepID=UPI001F47C73B|nr:exonuclease domain-containing protein [Tenacibaculum piscium]